MIRNMIFDMGGVLIKFDPLAFIARYSLPETDEQLLLHEVFHSLEWARMDRGSISQDDAETAICGRVPERLHGIVKKLITKWDQPLLPIAGMSDLLNELKQRGYRLYLLSNVSCRLHEYWTRVPGSEYFDETIISADMNLVKPQPEIYHALLSAFGLQPQECFFVDDSPQNVEGAYFAGINGCVFHGDVGDLRKILSEQNIL